LLNSPPAAPLAAMSSPKGSISPPRHTTIRSSLHLSCGRQGNLLRGSGLEHQVLQRHCVLPPVGSLLPWRRRRWSSVAGDEATEVDGDQGNGSLDRGWAGASGVLPRGSMRIRGRQIGAAGTDAPRSRGRSRLR